MRTATDGVDAALDAALDMTFPASDPVALYMPDYVSRSVSAKQLSPVIEALIFDDGPPPKR